MTGWNFADVFERIADELPDDLAQQQGERRLTWRDFDRRADGVATALLDAGLGEQDKVAQYLHNCPEYLESVYGAFKAGMAVVNTNYRYGSDELVYLWDNADVIAVVFHGTFAEQCEQIADRVPGVRLWLWVDDGSGPCPDWAVPYESAASSATGRTQGPWGRSGDHLMLLYTGGTTGMPKGVMWRQDDMFNALDSNNREPAASRTGSVGAGRARHQGRTAQHARRSPDARDRSLQRVQHAHGGRLDHIDGRSPLRPDRAARHDRAVSDQRDVDRR